MSTMNVISKVSVKKILSSKYKLLYCNFRI
ncbi:hypothetical protein ERHA55_53900 (plasmid) [Erwinia rhapontici]|nr:hypothetical protein ERHA55_53900 [Erwinia rhapontici]